jgi:glycosyltransferase involved in cell wall biosynthesis
VKIAILYFNFAHKGGSENVIYWMIKGLAEQGHQVRLITRYYSPDLWAKREVFPCPVIVVRAKNVSRYLRSLIMPFLLRRHLRDADIIHPHNYPASIWAALCKKIFRLKGRLVYFCQEPNRVLHWEVFDGKDKEISYQKPIFDDKTPSWFLPYQLWLERRLDRWAARQMDTILVNSRFSKGITDQVFGVATRVCLLGEPWQKIRFPGSLYRPRNCFLVLTRLHPAKNVGAVLEAYRDLHRLRGDRIPPLIIAGDGMLLDDCRQWTVKQGLADKIHFKGYVQDEEIPDLMSQAIALIFVPIREPFGLVTVEAFVNNTPAIVSDEGGPAEVVTHGKTGFLVSPKDAPGIRDKMAWFIDHPEEGRAMGIAAGKEARAKYGAESFIRRFLEFSMQP